MKSIKIYVKKYENGWISELKHHRDIFMEKHWKKVIHRSICDYFFEAQSKVCINSETNVS